VRERRRQEEVVYRFGKEGGSGWTWARGGEEGGPKGEKSWAASGQEGREARKGKERARKGRVRD
jgi:hypothetical protein